MKHLSESVPENLSMVSLDVEDLLEEDESHQVYKEESPSKSGVSELSKQLRSLQHVNHAQTAQINKLERKLQILSDLKGVSVSDMKSALQLACQGEAFNELRIEVDTLKAQLELARSDTVKSNRQSHAVTNLQLRVGELEEVEESLRSKLASISDSLREQTSRATKLEASSAKYQQEAKEYKLKYESLQNDLQHDHEAAVSTLQEELKSANDRIIEADHYLVREKERVSALLIQVAEYDALEVQLTQQKSALKNLSDSFTRQSSESTAKHMLETAAAETKLIKMEERALHAEAQLLTAHEKIKSLEPLVAKILSLEITVANQKDQLQQLMHESGNLELERNIEMEKLQKVTVDTQAKLEAETAKVAALESKVSRMKALEHSLAERDKELAVQIGIVETYKNMREDDINSQSIAVKEMNEMYENRISKLQDQISEERYRLALLEKEDLKYQQLDKEYKTLKADLAKLAQREKEFEKENEDAKTTIDRLQRQLTEADVQMKLKDNEIELLEDDLGSAEKEAKLQKKHYKSRLRSQEQEIEDLEQQLSSLVTAFNIERGERTEEQKTQTVLQQSLVGADSKVAHQLHDIDGAKQNSPPSPQMTSRPVEPFDSHTQVGIAQGYLLKKEFSGWKKKYFYLHGNLTTGLFTLSFGDGPGRATKGDFGGIRTAVSQVQATNELLKKRFCFVLKVNPHDSRAPCIYLAATCQEDLDLWMTAFSIATNGVASGSAISPGPQHHFPVGSKVVISGLLNHPEYNGLTGVVTTPLKDHRQCVSIDSLQRKVKVSPANLELYELPDSSHPHRAGEFL